MLLEDKVVVDPGVKLNGTGGSTRPAAEVVQGIEGFGGHTLQKEQQ